MPVGQTGDEPIVESPACQTNAPLAGGLSLFGRRKRLGS
ncbi:aldehyde dehydrogenase [Pseudomonas mandelii JR-1]|uniref:Aldehyde dehydrogenase n=1 Tax=Pseudomonas mandelii JR-1 TaxID=1147786 RepID=A0A024EK56_9PSED|nr:aldehyde dehydrogenase [Pseudomonas mandelii JR-1]